MKQLVYNKADEDVPPFGIMQIDNGAEERNGRIAINVKQPAGEIRPSMYLINGPAPIQPQRMGVASIAVAPLWCLFEDVEGEPEFDDDWGPVNGSWKIGRTGTGLQVMSIKPVQTRVIVRMQIGPQLFMAQVDGDIATGATGTFNRIDGDKGSEGEIVADTVQAFDRFGDVDDDSTAIIGYIDGGWEQVVGECP